VGSFVQSDGFARRFAIEWTRKSVVTVKATISAETPSIAWQSVRQQQ